MWYILFHALKIYFSEKESIDSQRGSWHKRFQVPGETWMLWFSNSRGGQEAEVQDQQLAFDNEEEVAHRLSLSHLAMSNLTGIWEM